MESGNHGIGCHCGGAAGFRRSVAGSAHSLHLRACRGLNHLAAPRMGDRAGSTRPLGDAGPRSGWRGIAGRWTTTGQSGGHGSSERDNLLRAEPVLQDVGPWPRRQFLPSARNPSRVSRAGRPAQAGCRPPEVEHLCLNRPAAGGKRSRRLARGCLLVAQAGASWPGYSPRAKVPERESNHHATSATRSNRIHGL